MPRFRALPVLRATARITVLRCSSESVDAGLQPLMADLLSAASIAASRAGDTMASPKRQAGWSRHRTRTGFSHGAWSLLVHKGIERHGIVAGSSDGTMVMPVSRNSRSAAS